MTKKVYKQKCFTKMTHLKRRNMVKDGKIEYYGGSLKNPIFRRGSQKTNI